MCVGGWRGAREVWERKSVEKGPSYPRFRFLWATVRPSPKEFTNRCLPSWKSPGKRPYRMYTKGEMLGKG